MNGRRVMRIGRMLPIAILAAALHAGEIPTVEQWGRFELEARSGTIPENPFDGTVFRARFEHAAGSRTVAGFYDGDGTWRVRFMPDREGTWTVRTLSADPELDGIERTFEVGPPAPGNHGPVGIRNTFHFACADGTPFFPLGTTLYNWVHREEDLRQRTLATLDAHAFNKVRFCIFPKWYAYNRVEPPFYPWPGTDGRFDRDRFNPDFFRHIERQLDELLARGIQADLILFHPYDRWGHATMTAEQDDRYLRHVVARLAAWRNVWWTLANEFDLMEAKTPADWDRFLRIVQENDPYGHPRSNHNCRGWYDHARPGITHCNIQSQGGDELYTTGVRARRTYRKPVVFDEYGYEGDIPQGWGNLSPETETHRHWTATVAGAYGSHGETYANDREQLWWSVGGSLVGKSPSRLAFLRAVMEELPYEQMEPDPEFCRDGMTLGKPGELYLVYVPAAASVEVELPGTTPYRFDLVHTWEMTVTACGVIPPGRHRLTVPAPRALLRLRVLGEGETGARAVYPLAEPEAGAPPLTVRLAVHSPGTVRWDFGDGDTGAGPSVSHVYRQPGLYTAAATVTEGAEEATGFVRVAVDTPSGKPLVRIGVPDDETANSLHGPVERDPDGTLVLRDGEPWKWIAVGPENGPHPELEGLRSFTILGYLRCDSAEVGSGGNRIACSLNYNRNGFDLVHLADGRLRLAVNEWPDGCETDSSPGMLRPGGWIFFAVTYDGTRTENNVTFFAGTPETPAAEDRTRSYPRGATGTPGGPLTVGNYNPPLHRHGQDRQFRGAIHGLRIYGSRIGTNGALSLDEIRERQGETAPAADPEPASGKPLSDTPAPLPPPTGPVLLPARGDVPHRGTAEATFRVPNRVGGIAVPLPVMTFVRPGGTVVRTDAFEDGREGGESVFKARAYCDTPGPWTWEAQTPERPRGSFRVVPSDLKGKLRRHPRDTRRFAFDNGEWFLHIGDTGYRYLHPDEPEWQAYIDQAAAAGFTKIRAWFCTSRHGVEGLFTGDRESPDLRVWQEMDRRLAYALNRHPEVMFQLIPYGEDAAELLRYGSGDAAAAVLARDAQARWSAFPNVTWCISNDLRIAETPALREAVDRIGRDMAAREPWGTLLTNHQRRFSGYAFTDAPWSDIITLEDLDQVHGGKCLEYRARGDDPVVLDEDRYERYREPKHPRYFFRRLMWSTLLSGAHATYGGLRTYEPHDGPEGIRGMRGYADARRAGKLDGGADDFAHIGTFFRDTGLTLVGLEPDDAMAGGEPNRAKCLRGDGVILVYLANPDGNKPETDAPSDEPATVSLRLPEQNFSLRWFDPRTGVLTTGPGVHGPNAALTAPYAGDAVAVLETIAITK